ncbi:MAG: hypothetical protein KGZ75_12840 [Syntrophomonadaceae bacterium]|jgi:hypothetical protein|nr:hypothetical protein [Syntrophomonadaceae bacterium]
MKNSIDELKAIYNNTLIPEELDLVVKKAIKKGEITMRKQKRKTGYFKIVGSFVAALFLFVVAVNASPAFANSVKLLPGGEAIVRLLSFFGDTAAGGKITDGQDIKDVAVEQKPEYETLTVELYQGTEAAVTAGHFTVTRKTHPYSIEVGLAGVRAFSAASAFPDLTGMKLFDNIYRLITLDDSAHRFVVTFKKPVLVEVSEQKNPARIIIKVREDNAAAPLAPMYSLRTASFPFGEVVGVAENILTSELNSENARLIMDRSGRYLAEEGLYLTKAEAEARKAEIKQYEHFTYEMHIEKREPGAVPELIAE